ncbi:MAG: hypothetical protein AAGD11_03650 [Planctomycetota bacterium]
MTLLIGIDEAGYGPNFGPLCVGATAWRVKDRGTRSEGRVADLYELLAEIISPAPDKHRIAIADSKRLYKPASHSQSCGLAHLERAVHTALEMLDRPAADLQSLLSPPELPWYADYNCPLPLDADVVEIMALVEQWQTANEAAGVELLDIQVRTVYPAEFNELTEYYGTKGAALSHVSLELAKTILGRLPATRHQPPTTHISCDKHGGRNRYAALLQHHFPDAIVQVVEESRPISRYRWGQLPSRTEVSFRSKGEAELPVALASMAAKYFRELAMRAFNAYWGRHVPNLKPTAGYPLDAKRFKSEIAAVQSKLGIDDRTLWRNR